MNRVKVVRRASTQASEDSSRTIQVPKSWLRTVPATMWMTMVLTWTSSLNMSMLARSANPGRSRKVTKVPCSLQHCLFHCYWGDDGGRVGAPIEGEGVFAG